MTVNSQLLKNNYLAHNRYSSDEYLISQQSYQYIMEYVRRFQYSIHTIPDDEVITCRKIVGESHTQPCTIKINEIVFE